MSAQLADGYLQRCILLLKPSSFFVEKQLVQQQLIVLLPEIVEMVPSLNCFASLHIPGGSLRCRP
eukprot:20055-Eustigmatos_ZCMA.PRE.1